MFTNSLRRLAHHRDTLLLVVTLLVRDALALLTLALAGLFTLESILPGFISTHVNLAKLVIGAVWLAALLGVLASRVSLSISELAFAPRWILWLGGLWASLLIAKPLALSLPPFVALAFWIFTLFTLWLLARALRNDTAHEYPHMGGRPAQELATCLRFTPDLLMGDAIIDGQHRGLFDCAQRLCECVLSKQHDPEEICAALDFLDAHVVEHFRYEEAHMHAHAYPETERHQQLHQAFVREYEVLKQSFVAAEYDFDSLVRLENFVGRWVTTHILHADRDYFHFLTHRSQK